jgi:hypothetical protein
MSLVGGGGDDSGSPTRKTHIKRIYKNDDPDTGLWIDIERIDELTYTSGTGFAQQTNVWTFDWESFDPNGEGVTKKKIQDPNDDTNPDDPAAAVIEVPVRGQLLVTQGAKEQYQQYNHFFVNDVTNSSRETHSRRVYHYDVPDDQLDENKNPPRDPQDYLNALGDKDSSQYLEVEILDAFSTNENETRDSHGRLKPSAWQERRWLVNNASDALLHDRDGDTSKDFATNNPVDGIVDPPWRLDPLQNIVNIGIGVGYSFLVAGFQWDGDGNSSSAPVLLISENGEVTQPLGEFFQVNTQGMLDQSKNIIIVDSATGTLNRYANKNKELGFSRTGALPLAPAGASLFTTSDGLLIQRLSVAGNVEADRLSDNLVTTLSCSCADGPSFIYVIEGSSGSFSLRKISFDDNKSGWIAFLGNFAVNRVTLGHDRNVWVGMFGPGGDLSFTIKKFNSNSGDVMVSKTFPQFFLTETFYTPAAPSDPTGIPPLVGPPYPPAGGFGSPVNFAVPPILSWDIDANGNVIIVETQAKSDVLLWSQLGATPPPTNGGGGNGNGGGSTLFFSSTETQFDGDLSVAAYSSDAGLFGESGLSQIWRITLASPGGTFMSATGRVAAGRKTIAILTTWTPSGDTGGRIDPITYQLDGVTARDGSDLWDLSGTGSINNTPVSGDIPMVPQVLDRTPR